MDKLLAFLGTTFIFLIPILAMVLYAILPTEVTTTNDIPEDCVLAENLCELQEAPENMIEIEFLERNYEKVMDQKNGNIHMDIFRERIKFAISYRPQIGEYLVTDSYRYELTSEAKEGVEELVDDYSYADTVENIHGWVNENIEYVYNRNWYTAQSTWERREANCNGISFLVCGMMREAGIPCIVVANPDHAWTEYLYVDDMGRLVWSAWDQGLEGYPVLGSNVYGEDLN